MSTDLAYVRVKEHRNALLSAAGHRLRCMHCRSWATVTATRVRFGKRMPVRFCDEHAAAIVGVALPG